MNDVLQVLQRPRQTINARYDERVAGAQKIEQHLQLGAPVAARAARLLGADDLAPCRFQGSPLDRKVLIEGGNASVAVKWHRVAKCVSLRSRPSHHIVLY